MWHLALELARTIDEDRFREAARCRRINEALAVHQKQPVDLNQSLVGWLQSLTTQEQRAAPDQQTRTLAELS